MRLLAEHLWSPEEWLGTTALKHYKIFFELETNTSSKMSFKFDQEFYSLIFEWKCIVLEFRQVLESKDYLINSSSLSFFVKIIISIQSE